MTITGTIPSAIANFLKSKDESLNGIEIKGNDVDIILTDKGQFTELYAIGMGNGSYEIIEIDDNLSLLPEYDEGDVISNDVLKKVFSTVINSSLILSFNPLGKIKYGVIDKANNVKNKVKKGTNKLKEAGKWIADIISPEDAQKFIRTLKGFDRAKVGEVKRIGGKTGGYYGVLFGNPADKKFYVWTIYRNGNEYRALNDKNHPQFSTKDGDEALDAYNKLVGKFEEESETVEQTEEDNVIEETDEGWQYTDDGFAYKISESMKKKKKKSKYNGCNVTGYEDGTLISPMSVGDGGMAVGSSMIKNNVELFEQDVLNYILKTEQEQIFIEELEDRLHRLDEINRIVAGNMTKDERYPLATLRINFYKSETSEVGVVTVNVTDTGIHIDGSTFNGLLEKLDRVIEKLSTQ